MPSQARIKVKPATTGTTYSPNGGDPAAQIDPGGTTPRRPSRAAPSPVEQYYMAQAADDEGNARCLNYSHGHRFLWCAAYGWLRWTGTHWSDENADAAVRKAAVATLKRRRIIAVKRDQEKIVKAAAIYAQRLNGVVAIFRDMVSTTVDMFDAHPNLLNCANGVINLTTGTLAPHDPCQRFTYCIGAPYEPSASPALWVDFLRSAVDDDEVVKYIQLALGYTFTGYTTEECLFYLYGPTRSGKGTFTETILALIGGRLGKEVDFQTFTARRDGDMQNFDLAPLKPARYVTASESNKFQVLNEARIKAVTGGNEIYCAFKHRDHFAYRPQFKLWLASNYPVNADPDDAAVWGRVKVLSFPHSRLDNEDKTLKLRLRQLDALQGLLAWIVEGALAWHMLGPAGLQSPPRVTMDTQIARNEADFVRHWAEECLQITGDPSHFATNAAVYDSYMHWCKANGVQPKQLRGLVRSLDQKFSVVEIGVWKWIPSIQKMQRCITGIKIL